MATIGWRFPLFQAVKGKDTRIMISKLSGELIKLTIWFGKFVKILLMPKEMGQRTRQGSFELKHIPAKKFKAFQDFDKCIEGCKEYWETIWMKDFPIFN